MKTDKRLSDTLTNHGEIEALWYTRCPTLTASSIAIRDGWLEREFGTDGIPVLSLAEAADRGAYQSHFSHDLPNSFRHGGNIPPIWTRSQGRDVRVIGLTWGETPHAVLALPESGIRNAADLRGRRLGLPRRTKDSIDFAAATYLRIYDLALSSAGLTLDDVEVVDLPVSVTYLSESQAGVRGALWSGAQLRQFQRTELVALIRGEIDAMPSSGYWIADTCATFGAAPVFESGSVANRTARANSGNPSVLTVSGQLIDDRPDLVVRWLVALLKAAEWGRTRVDETIRIAAQETGTVEAFTAQADRTHLLGCLDLEFTEPTLEALAAQKSFLLQHGFIKRDFELADWIAPRFLEQARELVERG